MKRTYLNGREDGENSQKETELARDAEQKPNYNPSGREDCTSGDNGDVRRDRKGMKGHPSSPLRKAIAIDEVVLHEQVGVESGGTPNKGLRTRRGTTKGREPLPKRKNSRQRNSAEALHRADERLRSVRDGRGYIDFTSYNLNE